MAIKVDPAFARSGEKSRERRAVRRRKRIAIGGVAAVIALPLIGLATWFVLARPPALPGPDPEPVDVAEGQTGEGQTGEGQTGEGALTPSQGDAEDFDLVQTEGSAEAGVRASAAAFVDLRRDPMLLFFEQPAAPMRVAGDDGLDPRRVGPAAAERITVISDELISGQSELVTALPSSREDLALFQARRSTAFEENTIAPPQAELAAPGELVTVEGDDGSWGALIDTGEAGGVPVADEAVFVRTSIGNTTTTAFALGETRRAPLYQDKIVVLQLDQPLEEALAANGVDAAQAARVATAWDRMMATMTPPQQLLDEADAAPQTGAEGQGEAMPGAQNGDAETAAPETPDAATPDAQTPDAETPDAVTPDPETAEAEPDALPRGSILALRSSPFAGRQRLVSLSVYGPEGYRASLAQIGAGRFAPSADPWFEQNLLQASTDLRPRTGARQDVRLLDAFYSAALRNGISTTLVGELIVMISKGYDLDRFAADGDRVTILMLTDPPPGQEAAADLLFASIEGPSGEMKCYIGLVSEAEGFGCLGLGGGRGGGGGALAAGLIVPVAGTQSSGFGPRMHPILHQLRNHDGLDWAAPTGTPVHAAGAGTISRANRSESYGNIIYIDHAGGLQTRYAHLDHFAEGITNGMTVTAGQLIGYVGTTGRSTGPHLHFELRQNGTAIDPLGGGGGVVSAATGDTPGSSAVEAMVDQIIRVESGGRADAANPNSTAVGLGQFIQSTWLRMMQTYRPDLVASMSREQLLALRTDPALSREMVRNLARENEAFLRANGHQITAGRLYLAHFLGPGGANTALGSSPDASVLAVMGPAVVRANSFLTGYTIADLVAWAERKMAGAHGAGGAALPPPGPVVTATQRSYMSAIDATLVAFSGDGAPAEGEGEEGAD